VSTSSSLLSFFLFFSFFYFFFNFFFLFVYFNFNKIFFEWAQGIKEPHRQTHSWKGTEIRDTMGANGTSTPLPNGMLILCDAPEGFTPSDTLDAMYNAPAFPTRLNPHHHELGAILFSDHLKQGLPLLFNRILNNAVERGISRGGIDMDSEMHVREMFIKKPQHNMMPENMKGRFEQILTKACQRGGLSPQTKKITKLKVCGARPDPEIIVA
jgi:hypothetical protein